MIGQKNIEQKDERWEIFEDIYINTYQEVYCYLQHFTTDEKIIKQLLILTYSELYPVVEKSLELGNIIDWLKKKADFFAETKMNILSEQAVTASSRDKEENIEKTGSEKQTGSRLDEASIFFEIKDYLNIEEEQRGKGDLSLLFIIFKIFSSAVFLALTMGILIFGSEKIMQQLQILREPFLRTIMIDDLENSQKNKENFVVINHKQVCLSEIGQVLYSLPLEETAKSSLNPEIQTHGQWIYYLPCPDREDSMLAEVSPNLSHILYRAKDGEDEIEIVAREVDDYCLWNDKICVAKLGSFQTIEEDTEFEKIDPGVYIFLNNNHLYLKDLLGRSLNKNGDSCFRYSDRDFTMDGDCILDVNPADQMKDGIFYRLKSIDEESMGIFREINEVEELFVEEGISVDSFCLVNDWLYYSVYIHSSDSSLHYSKVFRKSLVNEGDSEKISSEFPGRIFQMYFCKENQHIYANYIPKKGINDQGVIAVISLDGQISYLDDEIIRAERETSGNDTLKFVMVQDNQVYCYWQDEDFSGEGSEVLWKDALIIPNGNRIYLD